MSDENKPEGLSFDVNSPASMGDADDSFDFGFPSMEASSLADLEFPAMPSGFLAGNVEETSSFADSEFPAAPSGFLTGDAEPTPESETVVPVVATSKKKRKEKPEKKKREKKVKQPRESGPMDPGSILSLCLGILALLGLGAVNALIFTAPATPGIGGSSTIYYAVGVNVLGLAFVAVPFLFWKFSKGKEKEQNLQLFDVLLGIALMAFVIGVLCLLTALYRYDFTFKAARMPTTVQSIG